MVVRAAALKVFPVLPFHHLIPIKEYFLPSMSLSGVGLAISAEYIACSIGWSHDVQTLAHQLPSVA